MLLLLYLFPTEDVGLLCLLQTSGLPTHTELLRGPGLYDHNNQALQRLGNTALGDKGVITLLEGLKQSSSSLRRLG